MEYYLVKNPEGLTVGRGHGPAGSANLQVLRPGLTVEVVSREAYIAEEMAAIAALSTPKEQ